MNISHHLEMHGWAKLPSALPEASRRALRETIFAPGAAGQRCLLDQDHVRHAAVRLRATLISAGLGPHPVAIQAIAFDKTAGTNWKVAWHQDLMFPFAAPVSTPDFAVPSVKDGIPYARPPVSVLKNLLAVRLHLDDCDLTNGPLRICPGSHRHGIIPSREAADHVRAHTELTCTAVEGELLLMRPLALHSSSPAIEPRHRRVLHFVYYHGPALAEQWHREVSQLSRTH